MANTDLFIDIEKFVHWTYTYSNLFGENFTCIFSESTCKNWRSYNKFPSVKNLVNINDNYINKSSEGTFKTIVISDLIICINNAKDHNRGNTSSLLCLSSTEKKILIILLLGRFLGDADNADYFTTRKDKDAEVYEYLVKLNEPSNKTNNIKEFKYFPGRTFSYTQLCNMSTNYKNGITSKGINDGLQGLVKTQLVICIDPEKELFRLEFDKCYEFLQSCKKDT